MRLRGLGLLTILFIPLRQESQSGVLVPLVKIIANMKYALTSTQSGHYPSSCLLFKTQLNYYIGLSVPHKKHISPLQAQQVNAIYGFVTMVCNIIIIILDNIFYLNTKRKS
jgi:hypothetical protein